MIAETSSRPVGYAPTHNFDDGIAEAIDWYIGHQDATSPP